MAEAARRIHQHIGGGGLHSAACALWSASPLREFSRQQFVKHHRSAARPRALQLFALEHMRRTQSDLLPLPTGAALTALLEQLRNERGSSRQPDRLRATRQADGWLEEGICALSQLGGRGVSYSAVAPSAAQIASIRRMRDHFHFVGRRMPRVDPESAWRELARAKSGYAPESSGACSTGSVASYRD